MRSWIGVAVILGVFLCGCGARGSLFTRSNTDALEVGVPASEIVAWFGAPSRAYEMEFGGDVGPAWTGIVYEYDLERDPTFSQVRRAQKNRLVFAIVAGDTLLNNWNLEVVEATR